MRLGQKHTQATKSKMSIANKGEKHPNWKGGIMYSGDGCKWIMRRDHPYVNSSGYVLESRLIVEKALGRYLKKGALIHHRNEDPTDNRPENLRIHTQSTHMQLHHQIRKLEMIELALEREACLALEREAHD